MFERQRNLENESEAGQAEPDWLRKAEQLVMEGDTAPEPDVIASVGDGVTLQPLESIIGIDVSSVSCTIDGICAPDEPSP